MGGKIKLGLQDFTESSYNGLTLVIGAPGSGKSTFSRCLTMALCEGQNERKDIPFLASSKEHHEFFNALNGECGNIAWYELFRKLSSSTLISLPNESSYKLTLIVDGLDELNSPQETIDSLAKFLNYQKNKNII